MMEAASERDSPRSKGCSNTFAVMPAIYLSARLTPGKESAAHAAESDIAQGTRVVLHPPRRPLPTCCLPRTFDDVQ